MGLSRTSKILIMLSISSGLFVAELAVGEFLRILQTVAMNVLFAIFFTILLNICL